MKIKIESFKGVKKAEFEIKGYTTIVGGNGSGKTSILNAIQFFTSCSQTIDHLKLKKNTGGSTRGSKYPITPDQFLYTPSLNLYSFLNMKETRLQVGKNSISFSKGRNNAVTTNMSDCNIKKFCSIESPFAVLVSGLAGISTNEILYSRGYLNTCLLYGDSNLYFRNIIFNIWKKQSDFDYLKMKILDVFNVTDIIVDFSEDKDQFIDIRIEKEKRIFPIELAGTGLMQTIQIIGYALLFRPQILLLDEPDSHLHPNNQIKLKQILKSLIDDNYLENIVVTTHSRHMIDEGSDHIWIKDGEIVKNKREGLIDVLMDIGALDEFEDLKKDSQKIAIISEDHHTDVLANILDSSGIDKAIYGEKILSSKGVTNLAAVNAFVEVLDYISPENFLFIIDRDAYTDLELAERVEKIEKTGVKVIVTPKWDIEGCVVFNEKIVSRFLEIEEKLVKGKILEICNSNKKTILSDWSKARIEVLSRSTNFKKEVSSLVETSISNWENDKVSMMKGKFLKSKLNQVKGTGNILNVIKKDDNIFPELIESIEAIINN